MSRGKYSIEPYVPIALPVAGSVAGSSMGPPGAGYAGLQTRAYAHPSMPAHHAVADCICEGLASV